jgi:hypothetical protein
MAKRHNNPNWQAIKAANYGGTRHARSAGTNPKPAAHLRMIEALVAKGLLKPSGELHEITDAGHEWTRALIAGRHTPRETP